MAELTVSDLEKAIEEALSDVSHYKPFMFFARGTGIPDEMCIDRFKSSSIIVVTSNGDRYQYGQKMEVQDD